MNIKFLLFLALGLTLTACSHQEKTVNSPGEHAYVPVMASSLQTTQESIGRSPTPALDGQVLLENDIPTPVANVQLELFKKHNENKWKSLSQLTTDAAGRFRVTQKMAAGAYELRVVDRRYEGVLPFTLDSNPLENLIFNVKKRK